MKQKRRWALAAAAAALVMASHTAKSQENLAWDATKFFQYNVEKVISTPTATPGTWSVKVIFSVLNPQTGQYWDIKSADPFNKVLAGGAAVMRVDIGWDVTEFTEMNSRGTLASVSGTALGTAAALPVQIDALAASTACTSDADCPGVTLGNRYYVTRNVTPLAFLTAVTTGRAAIEGHPACVPSATLTGCPTPTINPTTGATVYANIPVRAATSDFAFSGGQAAARRPIVDIAKCKVCHTGQSRNGTVIPRLSLHGGNRTENLTLCVLCHNPNQTDVPYRTSGAEVSVDFKRMVHSIHAGGFRHTPFRVVGFNGTINDFSTVRFPAELSNCLNCHVEVNGRGTFELPLPAVVLGSTINTGSSFVPDATTGIRTIDVNPANDLRITPTAAACSGCHDDGEVQSHMIRTGGASFSTLQANIGVTVKERCASCHGPGKEEDVRRAHEIGGSDH